jgi:hypothetical protein
MRLKHFFGAGYVFCITVLLFSFSKALSQVTGGQYAFEYLRLANSPHVAALGGISVSNPDNDISLALQNPSLMRSGLHNQLQLNYNIYYADIKVMNLAYGYHAPKLNTSFVLGIQYLNYGSMDQTDPLGNVNGQFKAADYAITLGASRKYLEHWRYGAAIRWAGSSLYGDNSASAAMVDVGVNYYDTSLLLDIGVTAKNMGVMVKKYTSGAPAEPIPFDLQLGVSKKFKHLPLKLFTTLHHLYEWDIRYNNPADQTGSALGGNDSVKDTKSYFTDKLFRHFIFGAELTLGKRITATASYNVLRRKELALSTQTGLAGFAFGLGINLNKFQIHYGRSYYHIAGAYNEIGFTMMLNKLVGLGKTGEKIHWSEEYPDWE